MTTRPTSSFVLTIRIARTLPGAHKLIEADELNDDQANFSRVKMGKDFNPLEYNPSDTVASAPGLRPEEEEPFPGNSAFDSPPDDFLSGLSENDRRLIDQMEKADEASKTERDAARRRSRPSIPMQVHGVDDPVEAEFQDLVHGRINIPDRPEHPLHSEFSQGVYPESYRVEQEFPVVAANMEDELGTPEQILAGINPNNAVHEQIAKMDVENDLRQLADPDIYFDTQEQLPLDLNEVWSDETVLDKPIEDAKQMLRMHLGLVKDPSDSLPDTGPEDTWNDPIIEQVALWP